MSQDRVSALLDGKTHRMKTITTPEGVSLDVAVANMWERISAFLIDLLLINLVVVVGFALLVFSLIGIDKPGDAKAFLMGTLFLFSVFLLRTVYFTYFELAWQGRTPGKKSCGLRVINRRGGELEASSVIARNLTREVEFFMPFFLMFSLLFNDNKWGFVTAAGWILAMVAFPFCNKDRLRLGDLLGETLVIFIPKRVLLADVATAQHAPEAVPLFSFTNEQLSIYGTLELQVLEELLRRPPSHDTNRLLAQVCEKVCRKIGWREGVAPENSVAFLTAFYAAERETLERRQLFGQYKDEQEKEGHV